MAKKTDLSGFDRLQRKTRSLARSKPTYDEVLTPAFMRANTPWASLDELGVAAGIATVEEIDSKRGQLDLLVSQRTKYRTFIELLEAAHFEYLGKGLGFP